MPSLAAVEVLVTDRLVVVHHLRDLRDLLCPSGRLIP